MKIKRSVFFATVVLMLLGLRTLSSENHDDKLALDYYKESCPLAEEIVRRNVKIAVLKDPRMAASLLRLHFHDCFVMGCDASVLLDSNGGIVSEKEAIPNHNSLRGFGVIDAIKRILEETCPSTVSCADILTMAARDSVALRGGPRWKVLLGRKDSLIASLDGANKLIPPPNSSLQALVSNFKQRGLNLSDLVALSGGHTIGEARCLNFKQRINDLSIKESNDKYGRYNTFRRILESICRPGRDEQLASLDIATPARFDNSYFIKVLEGRGLLGSDDVLITEDNDGKITKLVWAYASNQELFFQSFVDSMVKMGNINVLTGNRGEIRKNCSLVNNA